MEDYLVLRDYERDTEWVEIFFFDHELTNGEISRIETLIQELKDETDECSSDDIEQIVADVVPYTYNLVLSSDDSYHTIWY